MSQTPDTSSISFTALYTGQVWQRNGLAAPAFDSRKGRLLYQMMAPFEFVGNKLAGGNVRTFLLQRHIIINDLLDQALRDDPSTQVLEIACGLSPRGHRVHLEHPQVRYIEGDLADMANRKRHLLDKLGSLDTFHQVETLNIFSDDETGLEAVVARHFDTTKPLIVITEGLVNYFPLAVIDDFWRRLAALLQTFPSGRYLTDNYPLLKDHPLHGTMQVLRGLLGAVSRSQVNFHFDSDAAAGRHMQATGFKQVILHDPRDYYQRLPIPRSRNNPLVRVIDAGA